MLVRRQLFIERRRGKWNMTTKDKILNAMTDLFSDKGYATSMSDVAGEVGIKVPSIYNHFSGKDEIILECVKREIDFFTLHMKSVYQQMSSKRTEEILQEIFFRYIEYFKVGKRLRFWSNFDLIPDDKLQALCVDEYKKYMENLIFMISTEFQRGIQAGELRSDQNQQYHILYITVLQGVLRGMLKIPGVIDKQKDYHVIIWNLLWESIKKQS